MRLIHSLEKLAHLSLPSEPITPPPQQAWHWGGWSGVSSWGLGLTTHQSLQDSASCSELTFPQLFSLDLGLHIHSRRELGVGGE